MPSIHAVFFDLDDTLLDKTTSLYLCAKRLILKHQLLVDADDFTEYFVQQNQIIQAKTEVFSKLAQRFGFEQKLASDLLEDFDHSFHHDVCTFSGVESVLQYLTEQRVPVICISNGRDFFQRNKIKGAGLSSYFSHIVTSGEFGIKKPDLRIFQHALQLSNANPHHSLYCGDNFGADIVPAKALGMTTVWKHNIARSTLNIAQREQADYCLADFKHWPELWQQINQR